MLEFCTLFALCSRTRGQELALALEQNNLLCEVSACGQNNRYCEMGLTQNTTNTVSLKAYLSNTWAGVQAPLGYTGYLEPPVPDTGPFCTGTWRGVAPLDSLSNYIVQMVLW